MYLQGKLDCMLMALFSARRETERREVALLSELLNLAVPGCLVTGGGLPGGVAGRSGPSIQLNVITWAYCSRGKKKNQPFHKIKGATHRRRPVKHHEKKIKEMSVMYNHDIIDRPVIRRTPPFILYLEFSPSYYQFWHKRKGED